MSIYTQQNGNAFKENNGETMHVGTINKVETIRVDNNTVEDVTYAFDLELGEYVEQSRTQRNFPDPDAISPVDSKIAELNKACNAAILAGFTSDTLGSPHTYDFGYDDQTNIGGIFSAIIGGIVTTPQYWKASGVPTLHTTDQLKTLFADGLAHKNSNIGKYWTLKGQVISAETTEEIDAIHW